jgi:hypothetical protein
MKIFKKIKSLFAKRKEEKADKVFKEAVEQFEVDEQEHIKELPFMEVVGNCEKETTK